VKQRALIVFIRDEAESILTREREDDNCGGAIQIILQKRINFKVRKIASLYILHNMTSEFISLEKHQLLYQIYSKSFL